MTGQSPGAHDDCVLVYEVEERADGIYVGFPVEPPRERTVSDVMVETMTNWGGEHAWGIVGHSNLGLADALREAADRGDLSYYGVRHEGAAAFAASAYGKLTGRPAACLAIAGPGATNLLTGLWDANVDRAPTLALTGQVATQVLGTGNFQEVDLEAAYGDVALFEQTVLPSSDHAELVTRAVLDWANLMSVPPGFNLAIAESKLLKPDLSTDADASRGRAGELRRTLWDAYESERDGWHFDEATRERIRVYRLAYRLDAMACLPLFSRIDPTLNDREARAAEHRAFVEQYL